MVQHNIFDRGSLCLIPVLTSNCSVYSLFSLILVLVCCVTKVTNRIIFSGICISLSALVTVLLFMESNAWLKSMKILCSSIFYLWHFSYIWCSINILSILCVLDRASSWYLNKDWPTRWHLLYYILFNMFQTLIRPTSGASEYLLCCVGWLEACWCYVPGLSVGDVVSECRLNH